MRHHDDAELAALARAGVGTGDPHLHDCQDCRTRLAGWQRIAAAVVADDELVGALRVPSFDALLGAALRTGAVGVRESVAPPVAAPAPGAAASWRLVAALVGRQLRLVPRTLPAAVALGLLGAVGLALATREPGLGLRLFAAAVPLLVVAGVLGTCQPRNDPRTELLAALPVGPPVVFGVRLAAVLVLDLALAVLASVVLALLGHPAGVADLVAGWLGQALLAAAVGVVGAVWHSPTVGASAAVALWGLGTVVGPLTGALPSWARAGIAEVWATSPGAVAVAMLLYGVAVLGMRFSRSGGTAV